MKHLILILLVFLYTNDETPDLNKKIIKYVDSVMGQKVGRGECWDLASEAMRYAGAYLDRSTQKSIYIFGKKLNPKKDQIHPGDIVQFENVLLEYQQDNMIYTEQMAHHTAIIYKVVSKDEFVLAHQNTSLWGKKVKTSNFKLNNVKKGKTIIYRPVKE